MNALERHIAAEAHQTYEKSRQKQNFFWKKTRGGRRAMGELNVINLYSSRQTVLDRGLGRRAVQSLS